MAASKGGIDPQNTAFDSVHLARLSQNAFQRMAHSAGIPRICVKCYETLRAIICTFLVRRLQEIHQSKTTKTMGFEKAELVVPSNNETMEFSKSGFEDLVRDLAAQVTGNAKIRFHKAVFDHMQNDVEEHITLILNRAKVIMEHSNRRVVYPKDVLFVVKEILVD